MDGSLRVALVSPKWNQLVNSYPPLGLGYLAAVLEAAGHSVAIYDLGLDPATPLELEVARIAAYAPDLIGFTAMTNNYHSAEQAIALLKQRTSCPIVVGGPHATLFPEEVVQDPHVDYVISGEGEETLSELAQAILAMGSRPPIEVLRHIRGLYFTDGKQVVQNAPRPLIENLDALPFPARHLYELERYPLYAPNGERMVTVLTSRGCPYNCSYCFKGIVGRTYRQRSPENVLAEVRGLVHAYNYHNFYFIDDLFTLDRERLTALTSLLIEARLNIRWQCLARVDRVTPELLQLMHRSGCREVHYGIETGNPEIMKTIGKRITLEQVRQAVSWTAEAGILAKGYFMLGLPGDTDETMEQTIAFASELPLDQAMFSLTTPFPGTRLWDELVARNPEIKFNRDFSQAYYYTNYDHMIEPFFNVSEVSDARLSELAFAAQARFQEAKRKRKYLNSLGPGLGEFVYDVSRVSLLRKVGHALLQFPPLRAVRGLKRLGGYDAREEHAQTWN